MRGALVLLAVGCIFFGKDANAGLSTSEMIALRRFGSQSAGGVGVDAYVVSPDNHCVASVTQMGCLRSNTRSFELHVFRLSEAACDGQVVTRCSVTGDRPGISQVQWQNPNVITFLEEGDGQPPQVVSIDLSTGKKTRRTDESLGVATYYIGSDFLIYSIRRPLTETNPVLQSRTVYTISARSSLREILSRRVGPLPFFAAEGLESIRLIQGGDIKEISLQPVLKFGVPQFDGPNPGIGMTVSPTGRFALVRCEPKEPPSEWWKVRNIASELRTGAMYGWWIVLDIKTGFARPLTGLPTLKYDSTPEWVNNQDVAFLGGEWVAEKPDNSQTDGLIAVRKDLEISLESLEIVERKRTQRSTGTIAGVIEGPNVPWKLAQLDRNGNVIRTIYDPNGELWVKRDHTRVSSLFWQTAEGAELEAGIYWPEGRIPDAGYPVVIQTHGFDARRFCPEGYTTTGYAAEPLSAGGVLVVQAFSCIKTSQKWAQLSEGEKIRSAWESMIDRLAAMGVVDRSKVGIQGFSRSCFHVLYFLTHSTYSVAAAAITDGVDASYMSYLLHAPSNAAIRHDYESLNGGSPFFGGNWLGKAPGFDLERVSAPVLITCLGDTPDALLNEWEPFAGLTLLGKPVELQCIPDAPHILVQPRQRYFSEQAALDWFRFWLQKFQRKEPELDAGETEGFIESQYQRWTSLDHNSKR